MNIQLYDVVAMSKADPDKPGVFMMRATLPAIRKVLDLHDAAVQRIKAEQKVEANLSLIHHNGRGRFSDTIHGIMKARTDLGPTIDRSI